ncbi:MAG: hypothetical protein K8W52_16930 [Deltaproteobacteria bacterium]|nr:hypothetical protein [Deltaproteobacteria bacterium]
MHRQISMLALCAACATACGASQADGSSYQDAGVIVGADAGGSPQCFSSSECPVGWTCSEFGTCLPPTTPPPDGGTVTPPEIEHEMSAPVSSLRFVWVALTDEDKLAKIDGTNLDVETVAVGHHPEVLAAMPGTDTAVVLDQSDDLSATSGVATVVRPAVGSNTTEVYATLPNMNRIAVSPDGRYAVAFFDLAKAIRDSGSLQAVRHIGSFQDVTVFALEPGHQAAVDLTVGFRPRAVEFDAASQRAYVVTDGGISIIDLAIQTQGMPTIVPPVPVTADPFADASAVEVHVVASGDYAVVHVPGAAELRVVQLLGPTAGTGTVLPLPAEPTDIDLAPGGQRVYALTRTPTTLTAIDIPGDLAAPGSIETADLGDLAAGQLTISPDGSHGLLYTNAILDEHLTVVDLLAAGLPHTTFPLIKSVRAVGFDPTGAHAMVIHARAPGDPAQGTTVEEVIDREPGYSSVDLASGFSKLQLTPVDPSGFTFAPGAPRAYLMLDGGDAEGATAAVQIVELDTGVVRSINLNSPPSAIGILPGAAKVFVNQRHALGRVTFIDVANEEVRTVTGFDLNSRVVD